MSTQFSYRDWVGPVGHILGYGTPKDFPFIPFIFL